MNLASILDHQVQLRPDGPAIIENHYGRPRETTFSSLKKAVDHVASDLSRSGLKKGDTVLIFYPVSAELYAVLLAVFQLGAVAVFIDPYAGRKFIEQCCSLVSPRFFIAAPRTHGTLLLSGAIRKIPNRFCLGGFFPFTHSLNPWEQGVSLRVMEPLEEESPALMTFTSGSTGVPKVIVRSQEFLTTQSRILKKNLKMRPGSVNLATLPIFLLANLAHGVTSLIPDCDLSHPGFIDPARVLDQIKRYSPETVLASPAFLERLAAGALAAGELCDSFQTVYTGGGPVFPRVLDKLAGVFPNADIVTVYGSSEAEPIAKITHRDITANDRHDMKEGRGLLVGVPIRDIDLRIYSFSGEQPVPHYTSEQFEKDCVPLDHPGEIVVRGDHVIPGYLGGRGDREHKLEVDGERWHRTGDSGFLDREGRLWLLGRCSERIIDGQGEVFPFSVEVAALHRKEIHRAALLKVRGKRWLVLEPKEKNAPFPLKAVEEDLDWADIEMFQILPRIPVDKRHNVKIDYPSLKKILQT